MDDQELVVVGREPEGVQAAEVRDLFDLAGAGPGRVCAVDLEDAGVAAVRLEVEKLSIRGHLGRADDERTPGHLLALARRAVHEGQVGVARLLRQEEDRLLVRHPAEVAEGVVDPGRIGDPVQRTERALLQVDRRDPPILVVAGVDLDDGPGAVAVERHGSEADCARFRLGLVSAFALVVAFSVARWVAGLVLLCRGLALALPFLSRLAQRRQRIVRDAREDRDIQSDRFRIAPTKQHQGLTGRLGGADLHADLFELDQTAAGHVVRHLVLEPLVPLARPLPQDQVVQRRREIAARGLDVLAEIVRQGRAAGVGGLAFPGHFGSPFVALAPQPDDLEQARLLALQVASLQVLLRAGGFGILFRANVERLPHHARAPIAHEPGAAAAKRDISGDGEEGSALVRGGTGELGQAFVRAQIAHEDVARLGEGAAPSFTVPLAAGGIRRAPVAIGDEARLPALEVDPVEIAGLFTLPLAQEVRAAAVTAPVRPLRLASEPVRVGHDPLEAQVVLSPGGKGEQECCRQNRAGGWPNAYSRYCSISWAVGASAWSGARLRNFWNWTFALAGSVPA